MPEYPFFHALPCRSCVGQHDFHVVDTGAQSSLVNAQARFRYTCPTTGKEAVVVPDTMHTFTSQPPKGSVPMARVDAAE